MGKAHKAKSYQLSVGYLADRLPERVVVALLGGKVRPGDGRRAANQKSDINCTPTELFHFGSPGEIVDDDAVMHMPRAGMKWPGCGHLPICFETTGRRAPS